MGIWETPSALVGLVWIFHKLLIFLLKEKITDWGLQEIWNKDSGIEEQCAEELFKMDLHDFTPKMSARICEKRQHWDVRFFTFHSCYYGNWTPAVKRRANQVRKFITGVEKRRESACSHGPQDVVMKMTETKGAPPNTQGCFLKEN